MVGSPVLDDEKKPGGPCGFLFPDVIFGHRRVVKMTLLDLYRSGHQRHKPLFPGGISVWPGGRPRWGFFFFFPRGRGLVVATPEISAASPHSFPGEWKCHVKPVRRCFTLLAIEI
jgi:hypothetical protein